MDGGQLDWRHGWTADAICVFVRLCRARRVLLGVGGIVSSLAFAPEHEGLSDAR